MTQPPPPPAPLVAIDLGRIAYQEAWDLQRRLVEARRRGEGQDLLLLCEHDEVVTQGRRTQTGGRDPAAEVAQVVAAGLPVLEVERGGAATYHGPGQLVGYPIVRLGEEERDLHGFLRAIEGALIEGLAAEAGLACGRREGLTGVWRGERKVASIGIACRGWVTYHGFALNLDVDLSRFALFRPCDLEARVMTSLADLGARADRRALAAAIHAGFARRIGRRPERGERDLASRMAG